MPGKKIIADLLSLHLKKHRLERGLFFAEGKKIVKELLASDFPLQEIFGSADLLAELQPSHNERNVRFTEVSESELKKISALTNPQDGFAVCQIPQTPVFQPSAEGLYLYLDAIRDPGNMGTLIRLADWFGVSGIVYSSDCVEWTNPKVIQSSMGSFIRMLPVREPENFWETLPENIRIIAADLNGDELYREFKGASGIFVISNEAHGLSSKLEPYISQKVHIPSPSKSAESLNAATAAAVLLGELSRRRFWSS